MANDTDHSVPSDAPEEVKKRAVGEPRIPEFDPTLGLTVKVKTKGEPPTRLVTIGDSLTHGFQSGAVFNTDISYPAIIAYELGWLDRFRYPRYLGNGGLPLNVELLLRELEASLGSKLSAWELPLALFRARGFMDQVEDYWERGAGKTAPDVSGYNHALGIYGWDLRDALSKTAASCAAAIATPNDDLINQIVENNAERSALRVYPHWSDDTREMTLFQAAASMGADHGNDTESGIETLVVFLGANNALASVTELRLEWSGSDFRDPRRNGSYTVWRPEHFAAEFAEVVDAVKGIQARHVIWCTVPHVTIAPIARGVGDKMAPGSRYFPYYTRPWVKDTAFDPGQDKHITGQEARAIDYAIDMYNDTIQQAVEQARKGTDGPKRDWYLLDMAGVLDRLAARRYISDPNARPSWWTPYPLPPALAGLHPVPDSRFLTSDGNGGRATGGLFSLDGVHPTTIGYGVVAQEMINIMRSAGVEFVHGNGALRADPITVDFNRLILRDTLINHPPQNLTSTLDILAWADGTLDWVKRTLNFKGQQ
jgi:hypothetical protein